MRWENSKHTSNNDAVALAILVLESINGNIERVFTIPRILIR